jgi:hypothetical protein
MLYKVVTERSPLLVRGAPRPDAPVVGSLSHASVIDVPGNSEVRNGFRLVRRLGSASHWVSDRYLAHYAGPHGHTGTATSKRSELAERALRILDDPAMRRINFRYGSTPVSGSFYAVVANGIREGRIRIEETTDSDVEPAEYRFESPSNRVLVARTWNWRSRHVYVFGSTVVHEATHVLQDHHARGISRAEAEGSAFVAQQFYSLLKAPALFRQPSSSNNLVDVATSIARRIYTTPGGYLVFADEVESMASKLVLMRDYRDVNTIYHYDGI